MSELDEIRQKYDSGRLDAIKVDLERFIIAHRSRILEYRTRHDREGVRFPEEVAVKFYLLRHRTINSQREIGDQLEEIRKEKWIRGVQAGRPPDEQEVAMEWARRYAAVWREHRVTTIVYVFDQEHERYCRLLTTP